MIPMGQLQELRSVVRTEMIAYAQQNLASFDAYMSASAVVWCFSGRVGLSFDEQIYLTWQAHQAILVVLVQDMTNPTLLSAHEHVHEMAQVLRDRVEEAGKADADFLQRYAEDFEAWADEMSSKESD